MTTTDNIYIPLPHRAVIAIKGEDRTQFLQGLITNDIHRATADQPLYALMLTPQGKFLYDFFIIQHDDYFLLDVASTHLETIIKKLSMYKLRSDVVIENQSEHYEVVALFGENIHKEMKSANKGNIITFCKGIAYLDPRHFNFGGRSIIERDNNHRSFEAKGFSAAPYEDYEKQRILARIPEADKDIISGDDFPLDFGLDDYAIDFKKGCYVGQEVTARVHHKSEPKKALYLLESHDSLEQEAGHEVTVNGKKAGVIRSSYKQHALALLRKADVKGSTQVQVADKTATITLT